MRIQSIITSATTPFHFTSPSKIPKSLIISEVNFSSTSLKGKTLPPPQRPYCWYTVISPYTELINHLLNCDNTATTLAYWGWGGDYY